MKQELSALLKTLQAPVIAGRFFNANKLKFSSYQDLLSRIENLSHSLEQRIGYAKCYMELLKQIDLSHTFLRPNDLRPCQASSGPIGLKVDGWEDCQTAVNLAFDGFLSNTVTGLDVFGHLANSLLFGRSYNAGFRYLVWDCRSCLNSFEQLLHDNYNFVDRNGNATLPQDTWLNVLKAKRNLSVHECLYFPLTGKVTSHFGGGNTPQQAVIIVSPIDFTDLPTPPLKDLNHYVEYVHSKLEQFLCNGIKELESEIIGLQQIPKT